jgi:hypothetical protein
MRRPLAFVLSGVLAIALLTAGPLGTTPPVFAATAIGPTTTCSNGIDNTGGLGLICEVTIVNTITAGGGSATVTVRECHGAAGAPEALCSTSTTTLTEPVTSVNQCNGSTMGGGSWMRCTVEITNNISGGAAAQQTVTQCNDSTNGGGGVLRCAVQVTNNFADPTDPVPATVSQCVGSGDGSTGGCSPAPATLAGATVTQCNASANGGTLVGLTCTATAIADADLVTVNQCNRSANGGGSLLDCSVGMTLSAPEPTPEPTATPTPAPTASPTPEPTASPSPEPTASPTPEPTATPTPAPTATPTPAPTATPTPAPTATPTPEPTATPTAEPTPSPAPTPTATPAPTASPTSAPTATPTRASPTPTPTATPAPTASLTPAPTGTPVLIPTAVPTAAPTAVPTVAPTPTAGPTSPESATPEVVTGLTLLTLDVTPAPTAPPTDTAQPGPPQAGADPSLLAALIFLVALLLLAAPRLARGY